MSKLLQRIITISLYLFMGVSAVLVVLFYFGGDVPGTEGTAHREPLITETFIVWAYILVAIAALTAIIFPLIRMVLNPKNAKKSLFAVVGIAIIVFIAWQFSSDEVLTLATENKDNIPQVLKMAGTQLGTMYILLGLAVFSIIYTEIRNLFR